MHKDIKYVFKILKGRFRILKYGMRFRKVENCDMLFKTLCAMHNFLIKEDGLDIGWMNYKDMLEEDQMKRNQFPSMLLRLYNLCMEIINSSSEEEETHTPWKRVMCSIKHKFTNKKKRIVRKMPQKIFIECLFEQFTICYKDEKIAWPRRTLTDNNNCN